MAKFKIGNKTFSFTDLNFEEREIYIAFDEDNDTKAIADTKEGIEIYCEENNCEYVGPILTMMQNYWD